MPPSPKTYRNVRRWRTVTALLIFVLVTASFLFFSYKFSVLPHLLHFQFVPALLYAAGVGLVPLLTFILLTFVFGRVYCSWLCPLGIWQDIVSRVSRWIRGDRKGVPFRKRPRYTYHKPHPILRWGILAAVLILCLCGVSYPLMLLDPYSNWGRIVRVLFSPLVQFFSNLLSLLMPGKVFYTHLPEFSTAIFVLTSVFFLLVTGMSMFRGRLWCSTVCPVGSLLGAISKVSLLRPVIDKEMCVACGSCSSKCKAECIDLEKKEIDSSRCVMCMDCMTSCARGGVTLAPRYRLKSGERGGLADAPDSQTRRDAVMALATVGAMAVINHIRDTKPAGRVTSDAEPGGVLPPGAVSTDHLLNNCTACHACISSCPSGVITYASGEYGLQGLFLPVLHYEHGFCRYDCHKCGDTCPSGAILPLTVEEKHRTQTGRVQFTARNCIVFREKTDCGACDEHCPTKAITMKEWKGRDDGLMFPTVNPDICIGCGACEYICPATPVKAMKVVPLSVQGESLPPVAEKKEEKKVDDFGF